MSSSRFLFLAILWVIATLGCNAATAPVTIPDPIIDAPLATVKGQQTAVIAGGCFWGIQAVFQHVKGVIRATSGYSGGNAKTAEYEMVSSGNTSHAESVRITYDPSLISYGQLLKVFFAVAHDPTQLNRQGPVTSQHGSSFALALICFSLLLRAGLRPGLAHLEPLKGAFRYEPIRATRRILAAGARKAPCARPHSNAHDSRG